MNTEASSRDRRKFLLAGVGAVSALGASGLVGRAVQAAMGPQDKFDLVIKGGDVVDPSQRLCGRRDIGIRYRSLNGRGGHSGHRASPGPMPPTSWSRPG